MNSPTDAEVEAAARAMFEIDPAYTGTYSGAPQITWEMCGPETTSYWLWKARTALTAFLSARGERFQKGGAS